MDAAHPIKHVPANGPFMRSPQGLAFVRQRDEGVGREKLLRRASWFIDDRLVPEREDLFAYYAGQDERQRLFRFRHNRLQGK